MDRNGAQFQKGFLDNLQLDIIVSAYTHCWEGWHEDDYVSDFNKFYFICDGEGMVKILDREFYPQKGQLVLMPAGVRQSYSTISSNTFKKYWCHFTAKIGDINIFDFFKLPYIIDVDDCGRLEKLFGELISLQDSQKLYMILKEKAILTEIIAYYLEKAELESFNFSKFASIEKIDSVLKYIQNHISENLTVEVLASLVHFHPNYFTHIFKKYMGIPPIQYINKMRIERAKYLLKTTDLQINEIALRTGFCDVYYFSKSFKSFAGYSPSDFRNI